MGVVTRKQAVTTTQIKSVMVCDNPECKRESSPYDSFFESRPSGWITVHTSMSSEWPAATEQRIYCSKSCLFDGIQP